MGERLVGMYMLDHWKMSTTVTTSAAIRAEMAVLTYPGGTFVRAASRAT